MWVADTAKPTLCTAERTRGLDGLAAAAAHEAVPDLGSGLAVAGRSPERAGTFAALESLTVRDLARWRHIAKTASLPAVIYKIASYD